MSNRKVTDRNIKDIFLANGFKEKPQANGAYNLNEYVFTAARALLEFAAQPSDGALTNEVPTGAIVNGAAFMDRIEANYEFRDQHGHRLANCSEWQEARRCFEHLAEYAARPSITNEGAEPVAWADPKAFENFRNGCATHEWMWAMSDTGLIPLYREPPAQAPVVLPERRPESYSRSVGLVPFHEGWNACLDELKRLNPTL